MFCRKYVSTREWEEERNLKLTDIKKYLALFWNRHCQSISLNKPFYVALLSGESPQTFSENKIQVCPCLFVFLYPTYPHKEANLESDDACRSLCGVLPSVLL